MACRPAPSLLRLAEQINDAHPDRSKASDGTCPSAAHSGTNPNSRHEPNLRGYSCARDITHDPAHGVDCAVLFLALQADSRTAHLIFRRRIWRRGDPPEGRPYGGTNGHLSHLHADIDDDDDRDEADWPIESPTPARKVPDMLLARWKDSPGVVLVFAAKNWAPVEDGTDYEAMVRAGIPSIVVQTAATWQALTGTPPPG